MKELSINEKIDIVLNAQCTNQDKEIQLQMLAKDLREKWKSSNDFTLDNACFDYIHLSNSVMSYTDAKTMYKLFTEFMQLWNALTTLKGKSNGNTNASN